jgi:SAM-dependent methyltransferase
MKVAILAGGHGTRISEETQIRPKPMVRADLDREELSFEPKGHSSSSNNQRMATNEIKFDPRINNRFRRQRLARFLKLVDKICAEKGACRILDVGGSMEYWRALRTESLGPRTSISLINLVGEKVEGSTFESLVGDARDLPFVDNAYDIVHSNSVIEHVGSWADMIRMANEIRRVASHYFVQTPCYWFPIEPHFRLPLMHWLPEPWRRSLVMNRAWGFIPQAHSLDEAMAILENIRLLDIRQYKCLFPDARIEIERVSLLPKSMIAIR